MFNIFYFFVNINQKEIAMNVNVTYERNTGGPTFQPKVNHLPPKADHLDSFPVIKVATDTDNKVNKTLEELASDSLKLSEPIFSFPVKKITVEDFVDSHGNLNNSTGEDLSFSSVKPPDLEEFEKNLKKEFKTTSVGTAIEKEPVGKQSCCVIS